MKKNRILSLIAGLFNIILGSLGTIFGFFMVLLGKLIRQMFESSYEIVEEYINTLVASDPSYEYLLDMNKDESIDFMMKSVKIIAVVFIVLGLLYLLFGILNVLVSKRFARNSDISRGKKIWLTIGSWLLLWFNVANILTTLALFLKPKNMTEYKLYSNKDIEKS